MKWFWCAEVCGLPAEVGCTVLRKEDKPDRGRTEPFLGQHAISQRSSSHPLSSLESFFQTLCVACFFFFFLYLQVDEEASVWSSGSSPPTSQPEEKAVCTHWPEVETEAHNLQVQPPPSPFLMEKKWSVLVWHAEFISTLNWSWILPVMSSPGFHSQNVVEENTLRALE